MKKFATGVAAIAAFGFVSSANAADMPAKAPAFKAAPVAMYNWTGFYIGGHAGFGSASSSANWDPLPSPAAFNANPNAYQLHGTGFLGGVQAGYNWQPAPMWVLGVEGDWSWTRLNDSASLPVNFFGGAPAPPARADVSRNVKWLASIRGRAGYLVAPTVLLYGTGGFAFGQVDYNGFSQNNGAPPSTWTTSLSKTQAGYVVGGGVEWAVMTNWLLRGEYLYYNLQGASSIATNATFPAFPVQFTWGRTAINTGRVALSYKF